MKKRKELPGAPGVRYVPSQAVVRRASESNGPTLYEVAVSSEYVVERNFYGMKWREVLDHSEGAVDMKRFRSGAAAVLEEHEGPPVGVVKEASLDADHVLRAVVQFSRSARGQEVEQDVVDLIRQNISVGYLPKRARLVEEDADHGDLWRITSWEPLEVSVVGVPADPTVGVGRSDGRAYPPVVIEDGDAVEEDEQMKKVRNEKGVVVEVQDDDPRPVVEVTASERAEEQAKESREVAEMAVANGLTEKLPEWLARRLSPGEVAQEILKLRATKGAPQPGAEGLDVPAKDAKRYSYARAVLIAAGDVKADGIEGELNDVLQRNLSGLRTRGGFMVPLQMTKRTLTTITATKAPELVFEERGELIELLRNRSALAALGTVFLTGLTAPVAFPKQTGAATAQWVGEGATVSASDPTFGLSEMIPKTLMGTTAYSRQLLMQASIDVETMVTTELAKVHALAIDFGGIHGLGAAAEPTGLYKAVNVNVKAFGGAASYALLLAMQGLVAASNADLGSLGWLMNPVMATNLRGIPQFTNTGVPVWTGTYADGVVAGYRAIASNQMSKVMTGSERTGGSELGVLFGNWADYYVGMWGGLELVIDPYSQKKTGLIEVTSFQMTDNLVRHGESFCKATGATA